MSAGRLHPRRPTTLVHALVAALVAAAGACGRPGVPAAPGATPGAAPRAASTAAGVPLTRAERTRFTETSRSDDVRAFLDTLARTAAARGTPLVVTSLGRTTEGRDIPLVIASRPLVRTPAEARALGRPIVWVQGNIHAGEVEGKEALQMLLRDLALGARPNVLDSLVLLAIPNYNADGNERVGPQGVQRTEQNGPELVGQRPNAQGFDLNRDYVKAEAPETRASLAAMAAWDPDAFVDLHTTDGSYHGYALTWSPSLHPSAGRRAFNQDTLLPRVAERTLARHGVRTFPYGNFSNEYGADVNTDTTKQGWFTYDHRPRFGTNYYGLRGGLSILSEAFSHDPFERRVRATYAFLQELLPALAAAPLERTPAAGDTLVALRARLTTSPTVRAVIAEDLARVADTTRLTEPGVPRGLRRTGRYRTLPLPVHDRFDPTLARALPRGGWAFDAAMPGADSIVAALRRHAITVVRLDAAREVDGARFRIDSIARAPRAFQGHREVRLAGAWRRARERLPAGTWIIPADQRGARLAFVLLAPESDDGLVAWNAFDAALAAGADFPVVELRSSPLGGSGRDGVGRSP